MRNFINKLRSDYELVIIDSAPVLPVVDTKVLAQMADKTIFVVQWEKTPRHAAEDSVKQLREFGVKFAGVVMTQVDMDRQSKYGYGDSSFYYGRYKKYYRN